ncbi:hypothetical protein Lal_00044883 [Lupinus albus]|nr:hypothetical protein Lal_00044883 [Lupinus albus]
MPFVTGLMNFAVPLQIGARDVAFPFLNNFSFWMTVSGGMLVMVSLFVDRRRGHDALRHQPDRDHREDARAGHDHDEAAGLRVVLALHEHPDRRRLPDPHRRSRAPVPRPLPRDALLHERPRRQLDVVLQPHLDLGSPGSLHPDPAGLRRVLGGHLDLLRQAPVRLYLDGLRAGGHHHPRLPRVAPPLLHHGLGRRRELVLRDHDDDHLDPDGGEDLQLDVHDVPWPHPVRGADDVGGGVHRHLRDRRHDRRAAGRAPGRLRAPQLAVPDRALPQRDHRRRAVRHVRGRHLLVPEGVRVQAGRVLGEDGPGLLGHGLLRRLHAALRARPDGRDPPDAAFRRSVAAALVHRRGLRRGAHRLRHRQPDHDVRGLDPPPRGAAGPDRRPVGRPDPRMVDLVAAAGLQLRLHAGGARVRRVVGHEGPRLQPADGRLQADPHAQEHGCGGDPGAPQLHLRLRHGLVHLVARRPVLRGADRHGHRPHLQLRPRLLHPRRSGFAGRGEADARTGAGRRLDDARVLAVPDERLPDLRDPVRDVWRARAQLRGGAFAEGPVRPHGHRDQHRDAAVLLHHLWLRHAGDGQGQPARHASLAGRHRPRLSLLVLHPGLDPRAARLVRHPVARDPDGPGAEARARGGQQAPPDVPVHVLALPRPDLDRGREGLRDGLRPVRDPDRDPVLAGDGQRARQQPRHHPRGAGARRGADGRAPRVLPAHEHEVRGRLDLHGDDLHDHAGRHPALRLEALIRGRRRRPLAHAAPPGRLRPRGGVRVPDPRRPRDVAGAAPGLEARPDRPDRRAGPRPRRAGALPRRMARGRPRRCLPARHPLRPLPQRPRNPRPGGDRLRRRLLGAHAAPAGGWQPRPRQSRLRAGGPEGSREPPRGTGGGARDGHGSPTPHRARRRLPARERFGGEPLVFPRRGGHRRSPGPLRRRPVFRGCRRDAQSRRPAHRRADHRRVSEQPPRLRAHVVRSGADARRLLCLSPPQSAREPVFRGVARAGGAAIMA